VATSSLAAGLDPIDALAALRRSGEPSLFLDGRCGGTEAWPETRVAVSPRVLATGAAGADSRRALGRVDGIVAARRRAGGPGGTGVALALAYEALEGAGGHPGTPLGLLALAVDASLEFHPDGVLSAAGDASLVASASTRLADGAPRAPGVFAAPGLPRTSLPREAYLAAVRRVKEHIVLGDVYQANLTQGFSRSFTGDPLGLFRALSAANPAPRAAYLEGEGMALASVSPEVFVDVSAGGSARTRPVKGTRPRGVDAEADARAAAELLASAKDRAELTMIVDLERNDLGRIARPGSVRVPELAALRTYAAVHHLVARVEAGLREGIGIGALVEAMFPGGSITGAPKIRAMEILAGLEPVPRGFYTGSLFWLDDDGSTASSILIRSAVVSGGEARIGAGGGIVADSDPEAEWMESNTKARALTRALGFEPEQAR
jgi:anthranilate/para-aminobenzoate synthase component I